MNFRTLILSALMGSIAWLPIHAEDTKEDPKPPAKVPTPPSHIPPPPPNLKPPSKAPTKAPPARKKTEEAKKAEAAAKEDIGQKAKQMTLVQLLDLPPEQLMEIRDTIDKLANLNPEEKQELKKRLDAQKKLEDAEKAKRREAYKRRREINKQAGILLWERMSAEEKETTKAAIDSAKDKRKARQQYINNAMKDPEFRKEATARADKQLKANAQKPKEKKAPATKQ